MTTIDDSSSQRQTGEHGTIQHWCNWLDLPLKQEKVVGPVTNLEFLGIILDTERMEIRLTGEGAAANSTVRTMVRRELAKTGAPFSDRKTLH